MERDRERIYVIFITGKSRAAAVENTPCCMHAQTYGLLLFSRAFSFVEMSMQTDTEQIARMYREGIQREAGVEAKFDTVFFWKI